MIWYAYVYLVATYDTYDTRVYLVEIIWWYDYVSSRLYDVFSWILVEIIRDLCWFSPVLVEIYVGLCIFLWGALDIIAFLW